MLIELVSDVRLLGESLSSSKPHDEARDGARDEASGKSSENAADLIYYK